MFVKILYFELIKTDYLFNLTFAIPDVISSAISNKIKHQKHQIESFKTFNRLRKISGNNSCSRGTLLCCPNKLPTSSSPLMYPPLPLSVHIHLVRKHYKLVASALHPISIGQNPKYLFPFLKVFVIVCLQRMLENKYKDIKHCLQILLLRGVLLPF